ncbi:MAG: DUF3189 family protein [Clostridiales bacterium]|nr:DUF3189 family protein [Clostridiales bacterium]
MSIIYYSFWGTYAAYTMAALRIGLYSDKNLPTEEQISAQYLLCRRFADQPGNLIYVGLDSQYREVYSLGCNRHGGMIVRALCGMNKIFGIDSLQMISAESLEGDLPFLIQRLSRLNFIPERMLKKLFRIWLERSFKKCLKAGEKKI